MKYSNVLTEMKKKGKKLEGKKKKIAKYIIANYRDVAFSTLSELAADASTSKATLLRVAQQLGFEGYQEMQEDIQEVLKQELTTVDQYELYNQREQKERNTLTRVLINDLEVIKQTSQQIDDQAFDQLTSKIVEADKVISLAVGKVSNLARLLTLMLEPMLKEVEAVTSPSYLGYRRLATLSPNSLLIAFGVSRYPNEIVSLVKVANQLDIPTIVITDSELSPVAEYSDNLIVVTMKRITWVDCYSGLLSVIQAIATDVSIKTKSTTLENLKRVEKVYEENDVFF